MVCAGSAAAAHLHVLRVAQELLRQLQAPRGHRGGEEQRLALAGQRREDPLHVGPEAHVQHAVRFVEDQHFEAREVRRVVPHVIHQPAGRGHHHVHVGLERALLLIHRHAAVDGDARDRGVVGEALHLVLDLHRQLARGRQHQRARAQRHGRRLGEEALEDRHQERRRLAGAGFGAGDHVAAGQRQRDHAALHRARVGPPEVLDAAQQPRVEVQRVEGQWARDRTAPARTGASRARRASARARDGGRAAARGGRAACRARMKLEVLKGWRATGRET